MRVKATDRSSDLSGGRAAIAGYVFQLILSAGLVADAVASEIGVEPADSDLDFLFSAVRKNGIDLERFDADAHVWGALKSDPNIVVQIKYSAVKKSIAPAELLKICEALNAQVTVIEKTFDKVDHVLIMTNRELSVDAKKKYDSARRLGKVPELWTAATWEILARLEIRSATSMTSAFQTMEEFGAHFGAHTDESKTRAETLLGKLLKSISSGESARVSRETITEAIVGSPKANFLFSQHAASHSREETDFFCNRYGDSPSEIGRAVRTDLISEISELALSSSLIAVVGEGGDGKTFSALQWLQARLGSETNTSAPLATIVEARNFNDQTLRSSYRTWLGLKNEHDFWPSPHENVNRVLSRCKVASVATTNSARARGTKDGEYIGPLFAIVVDGIDELSGIPPEALRSLLTYFASENRLSSSNGEEGPKAILVVTCRTTRELDQALSISGLSAPTNPPPYAKVVASTFSEQDLVTEALSFDKAMGERLRLTLLENRLGSQLHIRPSVLSAPLTRFEDHSALIVGAKVSVNPAGESISRALLHPVLWRCFKASPSLVEQTFALDEEPGALNALACRFLKWSIEKCRLRNGLFARYDVSNAVAHLVRVGTSTFRQTQASHFDMSIWASAYEHANSHPVEGNLGSELASSGVIVINPNTHTWSWRHGFVGQMFGAQNSINDLCRWATSQ